jgi:hypothetical protein
LQRCAQIVNPGLGKCEIFPVRFKKIGREESQAIDQKHVAVSSCRPHDVGQVERFFDSCPVGWAFRAMAFDFLEHLLIVTALGRGNKRDSVCKLGQLLRVAALAAANTAENEDDPSPSICCMRRSLLASAEVRRKLSGNHL